MSDWTLCDCPHCGNTLRIDATTADEWTRCPACRRHARIPDLLSPQPESPAAESNESASRESGFAWAGPGYGARSPREGTATGHEARYPEADHGSPHPDYDSLPDAEFPAETWEAPYSDSGDWDSRHGEWAGTEGEAGEEPYEYDFASTEDPAFAGDQPASPRKARKRRFGLFGEIPEWEDPDPRFRGRDLAGKRLIVAGVSIAGIGALVLAIIMFGSSGRTGGERKQAENSLPPIILPVEGEAALTREEAVRNLELALETRPQQTIDRIRPAAEAFLNATNWQERSRTVRDPGRVAPLMEAYYQTNPDGPIPFLRVADGQETVEYRGNLLVLRVLMRDYSTKQLGIEYTGSKFLVDWESFVGHGEMPMEQFREERPTRPVLMRVSFAPAIPPYFNYAFTDEENLECHLLTFPDDSYLFGYTMKFTSASNRLRELLGESPSAMAVLKLRYPENAQVGDQVWIDEIVAEGWILHEATSTIKP